MHVSAAGAALWACWRNSTENSPENVTNHQVLLELQTNFSTKGLSSQEIQHARARALPVTDGDAASPAGENHPPTDSKLGPIAQSESAADAGAQ